MQRASEYLQAQPEPVSLNSILKNVKGKDSALADALDHLAALQCVAEEPGPSGARLFRFLRPFTSENTPETPPLPTSAPPLPAEGTSPLPTSAYPSRVARGAEDVEAEGTSAQAEAEAEDAQPLDPLSPEAQEMIAGYDDDIPF
jgi:hypothetical protein